MQNLLELNRFNRNLIELNSFNRKCIQAIAELVRDCEVIDEEAIYNAIEDAGNPVLESWYDNCGEECYAGNLDNLEANLGVEDMHRIIMAVTEQVFELIKAKAQELNAGA